MINKAKPIIFSVIEGGASTKKNKGHVRIQQGNDQIITSLDACLKKFFNENSQDFSRDIKKQDEWLDSYLKNDLT